MSWTIEISQHGVLKAQLPTTPCVERELDEHQERLAERVVAVLVDETVMETGYYRLSLCGPLMDSGLGAVEHDSIDKVA